MSSNQEDFGHDNDNDNGNEYGLGLDPYDYDYNDVVDGDDESFLNDPEEFTSFISSGYGTRATSVTNDQIERDFETEVGTESAVPASNIMHSFNLHIPELQSILSSSPNGKKKLPAAASSRPKMTDFGLKMSQMILQRPKSALDRREDAVFKANEDAEGDDLLLEEYTDPRGTRMRRSNRRTGKRGRPKGSIKPSTQFGRASSTHSLPPAVSSLMGQANLAYVQRDYPAAIGLYLQVVQRAPASPEPYYSLGLIYEEAEEWGRAAAYFLLAAHLQPRPEADQWRKIASLLVRQGSLKGSHRHGRDHLERKDQAIYCLTRAIKAPKPADYRVDQDLPLYWLRAKLQLERGNYRSVLTGFGAALRAHLTADPEAADLTPFACVARLAVKMNLAYLGGEVLESVFRSATRAALPLHWSHLNLLLELREVEENWMGMMGAFEEFALNCYAAMGREQGNTSWQILSVQEQVAQVLSLEGLGDLNMQSLKLPFELAVKLATVRLRLGLLDRAVFIQTVLPHLSSPGIPSKLLENVADALLNAGAALQALSLFSSLLDAPSSTGISARLCLKLGQAYRRAGQLPEAIESFQAVLHVEPENRDARLALSEAFRSVGKADLALQILPRESTPPTQQPPESDSEFIDWQGVNELFMKVIGVELNRITDSEAQDDEEGFSDEGSGPESDASSGSDSDFVLDEEHRRPSSKRRLRFGPERLKRLRTLRRSIPREYDAAAQQTVRRQYQELLRKGAAPSDSAVAAAAHSLLQDFLENSVFWGAVLSGTSGGNMQVWHGLSPEEWNSALWEICRLRSSSPGGSGGALEETFRVVKRILTGSNLFAAREGGVKPKALASAAAPASLTKWRLLHLLLAIRTGRWDSALQDVKRLMVSLGPRACLLPLALFQMSPDFLSAYYHPMTFRYLARLSHRQPQPTLLVQLAHQSVETQSWEEAVRVYLRVKAAHPAWSFLDLCIGVALLWRSFQRTCSNPPACILQAFSYLLAYHQQQQNEPQAHDASSKQATFNLARAFHVAGLPHLAMRLYHQCLGTAAGTGATGISGAVATLARYNLSRLYLESGSPHMSRMTLKQKDEDTCVSRNSHV